MVRRWWKLGIAVVLALVALPVVVLGAGFANAMMGNASLEPGTLAGGKVTTLVDGFVAAYVLDVGDGIALIDAGQGPESIVERLTQAGFDPANVRAVFLTHGHGDHVGGVSAFPDAAIYALADERPLLEGRGGLESPIGWVTSVSDSGIRLSEALDDGDVVEVGDVLVEVFAVPGHTDGSAAYLAHGVLFLGDSAGARSDGSMRPAPWVFTNDPRENVASLQGLAERVAALPIEGLAFGHTAPMQGHQPLLDFE